MHGGAGWVSARYDEMVGMEEAYARDFRYENE